MEMETNCFYPIYCGTDDDVTSIEKLSNREKNIMELRFGFRSGVEKTQKEVADMLRNISKLYI